MEHMRSYLPNNVTLTVAADGDEIDSVTGNLTGGWASGASTSYTGLNTSPWAAPVGFSIVWNTGAIVGGKRLKGRSYFVPAQGTMYDDTGTLDDTLRGEVVGYAAAFVTAGADNFTVWQRPRALRPATGTLPELAARGGGFASVVAATVPDKTVVLTSRRD